MTTVTPTQRLKIARCAGVVSFMVTDVLAAANARAAGGEAVVHLEVGERSGGPPVRVLEVAADALRTTRLGGYSETLGLPALRSAIALPRAGRRFVRFAFCGDHVDVAAGADRLLAWLNGR